MQYSDMIQINKEGSAPLHLQIAAALEAAIRDGSMRADRPLPSVRALAERLGVSPATASAAYRDLVSRGVAEARPRSGYRAVVRDRGEKARAELPLHRIEPRLDLHPAAEFGRLVAEESALDPESGGYEDYRGNQALRDCFARLNERDGIPAASRDGILVSGGAQHAIALAARVFGAQRRVGIEDPVYPGARIAFAAAGARLSPIAMTEEGPDFGELEKAAEAGLDLFYCCPTYGNPSGRSWSAEARERTVALAGERGFTILEDDYLRDLDYLNERPLPLAALAPERGAKVVHVRTFSKCLLPALRIAAVSADGASIDRLLSEKTADDICGSAFLQRPLARFLERGLYGKHLERVRPEYAATREALRRRLAGARGGLVFDDPPAGLCLLGTLPDGMDGELFADACRQEGVLVSPGRAYWTDAKMGERRFRIGFGNLRTDEVERAVSAMEKATERTRERTTDSFFRRALL